MGSQRVSLGAIDVYNRFVETRSWFRGENVYAIHPDAVYPPASYALLGIVLNGLRWKIVKVLWYGLSLASVGVLSWQLVRHSLSQTRLERVFLGLMPFAFYATGAAVGNGQLVVFVLPLVLNAVLLLGAWIFRNRQADLRLLLAVTASVARIWIYHRWYDDLLLIIPLITVRSPDILVGIQVTGWIAGLVFIAYQVHRER